MNAVNAVTSNEIYLVDLHNGLQWVCTSEVKLIINAKDATIKKPGN